MFRPLLKLHGNANTIKSLVSLSQKATQSLELVQKQNQNGGLKTQRGNQDTTATQKTTFLQTLFWQRFNAIKFLVRQFNKMNFQQIRKLSTTNVYPRRCCNNILTKKEVKAKKGTDCTTESNELNTKCLTKNSTSATCLGDNNKEASENGVFTKSLNKKSRKKLIKSTTDIDLIKNTTLKSITDKKKLEKKLKNKESPPSVQLCPPEPSLWTKLVKYFRARENCPTAEELKQQRLLKKAELAAKAAGMYLVHPKDLEALCQSKKK